MKKILAFLLILVLAVSLVGCEDNTNSDSTLSQTQPATEPMETMKVAILFPYGEDDADTQAHIKGIHEVAKELNISTDSVVYKYDVATDESCYDTVEELASEDYEIIISTGYGHQEHMELAAKEYSDTTFVAISGDTAKAADRSNFYNAYTYIFEARYVAGVVAGMKIKQLKDKDLLTSNNLDDDGNVKIGYVGTTPISAVKSSYSAFYLGVKSVFSDVTMAVQYTNKDNDAQKDEETADYLISQGCVVLGQYSSTDGVAKAVQKAIDKSKQCYFTSYQSDKTKKCEKGALVSAKHNWSAYYRVLLKAVLEDEKLQQDWADGYALDAVAITELSDVCAEGTKEKIDEVIEGIKAERIHVFDTDTFTVGSQKMTAAYAIDTDGDEIADEYRAIFDGYFHESYFRSAPYFALDIDGITVLN